MPEKIIQVLNEEAAKGQIRETVRGGVEETLTYCDFSDEHWTRIRTNNVIGRFPGGSSALMLVCARLRHVAGTH